MLTVMILLSVLITLMVFELKIRQLKLTISKKSLQQQQLKKEVTRLSKMAQLRSFATDQLHFAATPPKQTSTKLFSKKANNSDKNPAWARLPYRPEQADIRQTSLQILGFSHNPTQQQLKHRMRQLAKRYHPDIGGDTNAMQRINQAYQQLSK